MCVCGGGGGGGGDNEVWRSGEREIIPTATLITTRMISALRWAAMRAILMIH